MPTDTAVGKRSQDGDKRDIKNLKNVCNPDQHEGAGAVVVELSGTGSVSSSVVISSGSGSVSSAPPRSDIKARRCSSVRRICGRLPRSRRAPTELHAARRHKHVHAQRMPRPSLASAPCCSVWEIFTPFSPLSVNVIRILFFPQACRRLRV